MFCAYDRTNIKYDNDGCNENYYDNFDHNDDKNDQKIPSKMEVASPP